MQRDKWLALGVAIAPRAEILLALKGMKAEARLASNSASLPGLEDALANSVACKSNS
jgi:hypothetical protein